MFLHARGEETLARFVEANAGPLFNQHADLAQFVFAQAGRRPLAFAHCAHVLAPAAGRSKRSPTYRRATAGTGRSDSCEALLLPCLLMARDWANASFNWSESLTSWLTVATVPRVPCEVWRVMLEIICIACATPSVPRTCCFEASEISWTSSAAWRTTLEMASSARPA